MTRYEHGFLTKCAEYGVDANTAVHLMRKRASMGSVVSSFTPEVAGAIGKLDGASKAARKIPWFKILAALGLAGGAGGLLVNNLGSKANVPAPVPAPPPAPSATGGLDMKKLLAILGGTAAAGGAAAWLTRSKKQDSGIDSDEKKKKRNRS